MTDRLWRDRDLRARIPGGFSSRQGSCWNGRSWPAASGTTCRDSRVWTQPGYGGFSTTWSPWGPGGGFLCHLDVTKSPRRLRPLRKFACRSVVWLVVGQNLSVEDLGRGTERSPPILGAPLAGSSGHSGARCCLVRASRGCEGRTGPGDEEDEEGGGERAGGKGRLEVTAIAKVTSPFPERPPCVRRNPGCPTVGTPAGPCRDWGSPLHFIHGDSEAYRCKQEVERGTEFSSGGPCPSPRSSPARTQPPR